MSLYKKIFLTAATITAFFQGTGSVAAENREVPYKVGEKLSYAVSYKVGIVEKDVGEVQFAVTSGMVNNISAYHFNATAFTYPFFNWFFEMRDVYDTWVDKKTLRPLFFKNNIREGGYRFMSEIDFNWEKMSGYSTYRNLKREDFSHKTLPLGANSRDGISMFYELRNTDLNNLKSGYRGSVELVLCDTVRRVNYRFVGREIRDIPGIGKCRTLKFIGQLATSTDESFKDGSEFSVWYSDDKNLIPLYVETPIRVGSVKVRLLNWSNLKHPFDCKVK